MQEIIEELKDPEQKKISLDANLFPPPLDVYRPRVDPGKNDCVNYGLNMYFKKPHKFSEDPSQGGGEFAAN